ncbi:O-antigen ligase family protein [Desulfocastanea catecholica]
MTAVKNNKNIGFSRAIVYYAHLALVLAAILPLSATIVGVRIYTAYVVFFPVAILAVCTWFMFPVKILFRKEEYTFVLAQLLIFASSFFSVSVFNALSHSLISIYVLGLYLTIKYSFKLSLLDRMDLVKWAFIIFPFLTVIAIMQIVTDSSVGVIANYFGSNSQEGTSGGLYRAVRVSGTFGSANVFALVYIIYGTILNSFCLFSNHSRIKSSLLITIIMFSVVFFTLSRGGLATLIIMQICTYLYWFLNFKQRSKRYRASFILSSTVVLLLLLVGYSFVEKSVLSGSERFITIDDYSSTSKVEMAAAALQLLQEPSVLLFGVGTNQFFPGLSHYGIRIKYKSWLSPYELNSTIHNWPLQIASENGILVLILYVYSLFKTFGRAFTIKRVSQNWFPRILAIILLSLFIAGLQVDTSGTTMMLLTPIVIMLAWIQNEYDEYK